MLNECCCSLDLAAVYASPFLNLITKNPLSPRFEILISFWFLIAIIAVDDPTATTLPKACSRMNVGSRAIDSLSNFESGCSFFDELA
jgi:hypothetical protein